MPPAQIVTLPSYIECHDHDYTQIVIGLHGQAEFEVSGAGSLVGPGQGCIVSCGSDHAFGGVVDQPNILVINLPKPSGEDPILLSKLNELARSDIYFSLDSQIKQLIQILVNDMRACPEDFLLRKACSDTVMALLLRHVTRLGPAIKGSRFSLDNIDQYIDQHLAHKISVSQLAGSVFLGESQFHSLFKEKLGVTPHQYVLAKRLEKAKMLIEQGQFSIGQVAELTGFSGQSALTHRFTRALGMSPSQYKKWYK